MLPDTPTDPAPRAVGRSRPAADRFESFSWTSDQPISLSRFQRAIGMLAAKVARAEGLFATAEQPDRQTVFQLAGGRATLAQAGPPQPGVPLVFIAELGVLSAADIAVLMENCTANAE